MVRACSWIAGAAVVLGLGAAPRGEAADPVVEVKIGLLKPMFKDVPDSMVQAGAVPFQRMLQDKTGLKGNIHLVEDYKELAERMKDGKIDIAVFHGFEYAWVKETPGLIPLVVAMPNCGKVQACLVVNSSSKVMCPKDLKGACVAVPRGSKAHCEMFLERVREGVPACDCCPIKGNDLTPLEALCEVANGRSDAALVDVSALLALEKELPAAAKKLRVLQKSPELPSAVIVYRKEALKDGAVDRIRKGLVESVNTSSGKMLAMFWQLKGFALVTSEYNAKVDECLKRYPAPDTKPMETRQVGGPQ